MASYCPLFITLLLTAAIPHSHENESHEMDCSEEYCEPGYFCYKETSRCAPCIDCGTRFRHNTTLSCHEKGSHCGDCLPGYVEPKLATDVLKESCEPGVTSETPSTQSGTVLYYVAFLIVVCMLSLFLMASFVYRWHKERRVSSHQEAPELQELMVTQQPPPPYSPYDFKSPADADVGAVPTAPVLESSTVQVDSPRNCDTNIYVETRLPQARERLQLVQAVVCNPPNYVNTRDYRPETPQSPMPPSSEDSGDGTFGDTIHDENTQESHWTPNTSQEDVEESGSQQMGANRGPDHVGSTAVGTVDVPEVGNHRETRLGRRDSTEDLASSQESHDEAPREKRKRSKSPPPQQTRNFIFLQNNNNNNQVSFNVNLNLHRNDDHGEQQDQNSNALVDSEDCCS